MAGDDQTGYNNPKGFNECVSQEQLQAIVEDAQKSMNEAVWKAIIDALIELNIGNNMERLDKQISMLTDKVTELETFVAGNNDVSDSNTNGLLPEDMVHDASGNIDRAAFRQARLQWRLHRNTIGMGGIHHHQGNNHRVPDDPYAKIKFTIPSFLGHYDAEGYLDWEMTVEQKCAHLVPEQHRVRQATSEFKDFAIIWWNGLATQDALLGTWEELKVAMRDHFVPLLIIETCVRNWYV